MHPDGHLLSFTSWWWDVLSPTLDECRVRMTATRLCLLPGDGKCYRLPSDHSWPDQCHTPADPKVAGGHLYLVTRLCVTLYSAQPSGQSDRLIPLTVVSLSVVSQQRDVNLFLSQLWEIFCREDEQCLIFVNKMYISFCGFALFENAVRNKVTSHTS